VIWGVNSEEEKENYFQESFHTYPRVFRSGRGFRGVPLLFFRILLYLFQFMVKVSLNILYFFYVFCLQRHDSEQVVQAAISCFFYYFWPEPNRSSPRECAAQKWLQNIYIWASLGHQLMLNIYNIWIFWLRFAKEAEPHFTPIISKFWVKNVN
jgi:hypothetical protein